MNKTNSISRTTLNLAITSLALVLVWGCSSLGKGRKPAISKGPYVQAPGPDTMSVMWESLADRPGAVRFWRDGQPEQQIGPIIPRPMAALSPVKRTNLVTSVTNGMTVTTTNVTTFNRTNLFYVYRAVLTNLLPGTRYSYFVELAGRRTAPKTFRTLNPGAESVRFIAYGDSRSNPKVHRRVARHFLDHDPEFILHTGDLVAAGRDYGQWRPQFFEPVKGIAEQVPFFAVPGNHEEDLKNYLAYFPMHGSNRWYSFDAGPVHVLALDYHFDKETHEQFTFAQKDLRESTAPWKVVFLHNPIFNVGGHNSGWGHKHYLPLFREAQVDLVFAGHSHMYERFRPIAPANSPGVWPVIAITTGGGGAGLHQPYPHPAHAFAVSTNHFVAVEATRDRLLARVIRVDGAEIDRFEIHKPGGRHTPEFRAQVYPEEGMKLTYELRPNLLAKLASLPTNRQPAMAMITLPPLKTTAQPVELEITLLPQSAKHYSVKELPLRVTTPAANETDKVLWVTVHYTGRKEVKGSTLRPPLVFQARVIADGGEIFVCGPESRTSGTAARLLKELLESDPPASYP